MGDINGDVWDLDHDDVTTERMILERTQQKLKREFTNAGYRAGLDASKATTMQEGFDQGLTHSIPHGQTAGTVLGALVARRTVCQRLGTVCPPQVDALIMRLRALKHTQALSETATDNVPTTESFKALVEEANAVLHTMSE
ncbi:Diphthamide biosynthesis protein 1 [Coemansia sp. RSA 1199]|nr:Diphthamide biosynthesis protein 1 [Coemansia sp. RSA 1199]